MSSHEVPQRRYPVKQGPYSSHSRIVRLVGPGHGKRLLDVGCAQGFLSSEFVRLGWNVTGVEPDQRDAAEARAAGLDIIEGDLDVAAEHLEVDFDVIVAADVLEHMADPGDALRKFLGFLAPGGTVVASIPNIAHAAVRAQLLMGSFNYTERGPLDKTHLRFYTKRTVAELFEEAGYAVGFLGVTPAPLEVVAPLLGVSELPHSLHLANQAFANAWPGGLGYQFLIVARPSS